MDIGLYHPALKQKGGSEKVVLEYAKNSQHNVTIYTLFHDEEQTFEELKNMDVKEIGPGGEPRNPIDYGLRFGLGSLLYQPPEDVDALLVSETGLGSPFILRKPDYETLCYCHTPLRANLPDFRNEPLHGNSLVKKTILGIGLKIHRIIENYSWSNYDKVLCNSNKTKERIGIRELWSTSEVEVVPPGVNLPEETPSEREEYIIYPSRFREYKRQHLAIEAFKNANTQDFNLMLVGSSQEEEYVERLKEVSGEDVVIEKDVPQGRWRKLIAQSHCVVFTPEKEDWGMVPIEAGAFGKPTVGVDEGGLKETIDHQETGYRTEADAQKIGEKIEHLIQNPEKAKNMGQKAREKSEQYSWKEFSKKIDRQFGENKTSSTEETEDAGSKAQGIKSKIAAIFKS
jgi:alpha-1,3/alpha-1,6-mannosyltransferase